MKRLYAYRKSPINIIRIKYGKETITFNLFEETRIDPERLDTEIKGMPSKYGFLLLLHKKLLTKFEEAKSYKDKIRGSIYLNSKGKTGKNNRLYSDDASKAYTEGHERYIQAKRNCIRIKNDADLIYSCIKAMEMRANLLQTLSSNKRKETF